MEDLPLGRIAALVPEFAVKDLPLGRTLMMPKVKAHESSRLNTLQNEFVNDLICTDVKILFCRAYEKKNLGSEKRFHVTQHVNSTKHKQLLTKNVKKSRLSKSY